MSSSTKQLVLENSQFIPEIFGTQDLNLKLIEKKFNIRITTRENQISIKGEPSSLESVENLLHQLENLHKNDHPLENGDIKFAIRLIAENPQADLKTIFTERIAVSPKKRFYNPQRSLSALIHTIHQGR